MNFKEKSVEWGIPLISAMCVVALGLFTSGCGGGGSDTATTNPTQTNSGTSINPAEIIGVSGSNVVLSGSWGTACYAKNGSDFNEGLLFSGPAVTYETFNYTSTDLSCTGTATSVGSYSADITVKTASSMTGWVDGGGNAATAPTAQVAPALLPATAAYTMMDYTFTAVGGNMAGFISVGQVAPFGYVADDTASGGEVLYRFKDDAAKTVSTADPFIKG